MAYTVIDDPEAYFQVKTYTGDGTDPRTITLDGDTDMQPDFIWHKNLTDAGYRHVLVDSVRGVTEKLRTDTNAAEETLDAKIMSFVSDGFTVDDNGATNASAKAYVAWCWKAGTTGSGTTTGTGTGKAYSYSVSTTSGFSIVKYLGNGSAGHTIPHHLGVVPDMITVKNLSSAGEWRSIFPNVNTANYNLNFNATNPWNDGTEFNDTMPTTSVFTLSTAGDTNTDDSSYIAYCWNNIAGYSKFGSYTGNGDADGTFVYLGFKPAFFLIKNTSAVSDWNMRDSKRGEWSPGNPRQWIILGNTDAAQTTSSTYAIDLLSNGFKCRATINNENTSGNSYIYMAFAEAPFVNSNGVPCNAR